MSNQAKMSLAEIAEQLQSCNYECEAGALDNNVAFIELKRHAKAEGCQNWGEKKPGVYGPCGDCACCRIEL